MRHNVDYRKLGRTTEHRISMLRNQAVSLIKYDRIQTTLQKAKELRRFVERLISLAKKDTLAARRLAAKDIHDKEALKKLFETLGPLNAQRSGGYTRIIRYGFRRGDNAEEAIIELVGREKKFEDKTKKKAKKAEAEKSVKEKEEKVYEASKETKEPDNKAESVEGDKESSLKETKDSEEHNPLDGPKEEVNDKKDSEGEK